MLAVVDYLYIIDEYDMVESCLIHYENTKQFTNKRIAELEKYVNTQEIYLNNVEQEKEKYKNTYFQKDNKDISI